MKRNEWIAAVAVTLGASTFQQSVSFGSETSTEERTTEKERRRDLARLRQRYHEIDTETDRRRRELEREQRLRREDELERRTRSRQANFDRDILDHGRRDSSDELRFKQHRYEEFRRQRDELWNSIRRLEEELEAAPGRTREENDSGVANDLQAPGSDVALSSEPPL